MRVDVVARVVESFDDEVVITLTSDVELSDPGGCQ